MTDWREENARVAAAGLEAALPWQLSLYVAGFGARSERALANLQACCEQHLAGQYTIEVIDVQASPQLVGQLQLLALPALVRYLPNPRQCLVGDLSNHERLLHSLTADATC